MKAVKPLQCLRVCISYLEGWEYFYLLLAWRYEIIGLLKKNQEIDGKKSGLRKTGLREQEEVRKRIAGHLGKTGELE
jgi:hypothetical protein